MREIQFLRDEKSALNAKIEKLESQLEDLKRDRYGRSNEKHPRKPKPDKGTTKEEDEKSFIENEGEPSTSESCTDADGVTAQATCCQTLA